MTIQKTNPKVFIEGARKGSLYHVMMLAWGYTITNEIAGADLILFTGGEDVDPYLYGEEPHPTTWSAPYRDRICIKHFEYATLNNVPMAGICRGSQFLTVANGHKLWQNVNNHTRNHDAVDFNGNIIHVSSTHHQMMRPTGEEGIDYLLLMTASESTVKESCDESLGVGSPEFEKPDVECVLYPQTRSLAFQPHPEFFTKEHPCQKWFMTELAKLIGGPGVQNE